jgi:hypothetical protein
MDPILANITKIPGVIAAGLFAPNDACAGFHANDEGYEPVILLAAIQAAEEALNVFRTGDGLGEAFVFSLELEHGFFFYRRAGLSRLGVIASSNINLAVIEVAINAATLKLAGHGAEYTGGGGFPAYPTMGGVGSMPGVAMGAGHMPGMPGMPQMGMGGGVPQMFPQPRLTPSGPVPVVMPQRPTGSQSVSMNKPGFSSTGSSSGVTDTWTPEEMTVNGARMRGSVGPAVMQHVLKALSRYVGVNAKSIIVEELTLLNATPASVMPAIFTDFIHNVASRIPDPGVQDEFIGIALGDRK